MDQLTVETDLFEHREVKPHFINPCCFGEDFAEWLRGQVAGLASSGFEIGGPIQEDYGWGFWVSRGKDHYWVALSFCGEGPTEEPGQWVVSVTDDPGLNPFRRLFRRPDTQALARVRQAVWDALRRTPGMRVVDEESAV